MAITPTPPGRAPPRYRPAEVPTPPPVPPPPPPWLVRGCAILVLLGVVLRAQDLWFPFDYSFDERHFVDNALHYLTHHRDTNDHPPLGKLFIAASIAAFGNRSFAWRLPSLIAGIANIALAGALGRALFRDRAAGWLAAALVATDGMFLVYSRTALMDEGLTALFLASALTISVAQRPRAVALSAALAGAATAVKFSGIVLVGPILVACLMRRNGLPRWAVLGLLALPVTYGAAFTLGLSMAGKPHAPADVVAATQALLHLQLGLNDWTNPWVSHWYSWALPWRPITLRYAKLRTGDVRAMTTLGNLASWWGVLVAVCVTLVATVRALVTRVPDVLRRPDPWLVLLWAAPIVPWIVSDRDSYVYHYLPAYGFGLVLLAGLVTRARERHPRRFVTFFVAVTLVFAAYAPIWAQLPVRPWIWRLLLFLPSWR